MTLIEIYLSIAILSLISLIFLLARQDAIIKAIENGEKYHGFFNDVFWPIMQTGGILNPTILLPWFDFEGKTVEEKKHIIIKNKLILLFFLIVASMIMLCVLTANN